MKNQIILFIGLLFIGSNIFAQWESRVEKKFTVSSGASLFMNNSFGDITVDPYSGNVIDILVVITAEGKSDKDMTAFFNDIKIKAEQSGNDVSVITINNHNGGGIFNTIKNFSIDYTVKIPENTKLEIKSTFGDVKVNGTSGTLDLNVQHGDLFIGNASTANNLIKTQFSDVRIESMGKSVMNIQHGDLNAEKIYDMKLDMQFGDAKIDLLSGTCDLDVKHGDLRISQASSKLQSLIIDTQFSNVRISGLAQSNFEIDLEGSFTDFSWEGGWIVDKHSTGMHESNYSIKTKNSEGTVKKIRIEASHSDVDLD